MKPILTPCLLLLIIAASAAGQEYTIYPLGGLLTGKDVFGLESAHGWLYAAADTSGVYLHNPMDLTPAGWRPLGLNTKRCRDIAVHPLNRDYMLVAADWRQSDPGEPTMIYRTTDGGMAWEPSQEGIPLSKEQVSLTSRIRFNPSDPARALFAAIGKGYFLSSDTGKSWTPIAALENMTINDIIWDTAHPGTMFAGGETMIFSPVLLKSTDWGATWTNKLAVSLGGDNAVDGIAINPFDPNLIVAGTEGYILRSTDGGETWGISAHPDRYYLFAVAWDREIPSDVFVAGGNLPPHTGGIFASHDGGIEWDTVAFDQFATIQRGVTSPSYPRTFIFSAGYFPTVERDTMRPGGVYMAIRQPASVHEPKNDSRAWFDGEFITIRAGDVTSLRWELYDVLGRPIRSGTTGAGDRTAIRTREMPNGVYVLRYGGNAGENILKIGIAK